MKTCYTCGYVEKDETSMYCTKCGGEVGEDLATLMESDLKTTYEENNKWDTAYHYVKDTQYGKLVIIFLLLPVWVFLLLAFLIKF